MNKLEANLIDDENLINKLRFDFYIVLADMINESLRESLIPEKLMRKSVCQKLLWKIISFVDSGYINCRESDYFLEMIFSKELQERTLQGGELAVASTANSSYKLSEEVTEFYYSKNDECTDEIGHDYPFHIKSTKIRRENPVWGLHKLNPLGKPGPMVTRQKQRQRHPHATCLFPVIAQSNQRKVFLFTGGTVQENPKRKSSAVARSH